MHKRQELKIKNIKLLVIYISTLYKYFNYFRKNILNFNFYHSIRTTAVH